MQAPYFPFDAVLFDLDGTLVATDRFWPDAARTGALEAFAELGLERALPTSEQWMSMVGLPLAEGFDQVFSDLGAAQRKRVMQACVEQEHKLLKEGRMGWLPGVEQTLRQLHERGVWVGVASNCSQAYLDAMLGSKESGAQGLGAWVHEARCLHTPGIRNKADMLRELLILFQTRSAVMVGDRAGDRMAAWHNGLPHVHLTRGYAQDGEGQGAEAMLSGMDELIPRLMQRNTWLQNILQSLALGEGTHSSPGGVLLLTGPLGAGRSWLARDLARLMNQEGQTASCLDASEFCTPGLRNLDPQTEDPEQILTCLDRSLFERRLGERGAGWTLVYGPLLQQPWVLRLADRILHVHVSPEVQKRRIEGGCLQERLPDLPIELALGAWRRAEQTLQERFPAASIAHAAVLGDNPLG